MLPPPDDDLEAALDLFFQAPHANRIDGWVSTLFLCRKELQDCLIGTVVAEAELLTHKHHRLFATAMVALSGFELLGQILPPPPVPPKTKQREEMFKRVVMEFGPAPGESISADQAGLLWSYRNALSHTFGLFHMDSFGRVVPIRFYDQNGPAPLVRKVIHGDDEGAEWEVNLDGIVETFLRAAWAVERHVRSTPALHGHFLQQFARYGRLWFADHDLE
jgi:hypothetical protein